MAANEERQAALDAIRAFQAAAPAVVADAVREAIDQVEAEPQKPTRDEQVDELRRRREAQAQASREAYAAQVETDRQYWRAQGIEDDAALARLMSLPRAERDRLLAEGMDAPAETDWRVAIARLMPKRYGAALEAIDQARALPDVPDLGTAWFRDGRADLMASVIPGARLASEVPISPEEAREAERFYQANPDLRPQTPEQPKAEPKPEPPRDEAGRFVGLSDGQRARIRAALPRRAWEA